VDARASAELRLTTVRARGVFSENRLADRAAQKARAPSILPVILEFTPAQCGSSIETRLCVIKQRAFAFPGQILNPDNGKRKADIAERLDWERCGDNTCLTKVFGNSSLHELEIVILTRRLEIVGK
jgi:hypothetical protein